MIDLVVSSSFTAFFRSIDHKILVRAWLPSPYIVVHSFEKGCKRAFKAIIKRRPDLKPKIEAKLRLLATDPYNPILRTHKLKGKLSGAWACSVEYDCRIVFSFQNQAASYLEELSQLHQSDITMRNLLIKIPFINCVSNSLEQPLAIGKK